MAKKFDAQKMRKELLELYREFVKDPHNKETKSRMLGYEGKWAGLLTYKDYLKQNPVPEDIEYALSHVSDMGLYGEGLQSDENCILKAKEAIKKLEKNF